MAPRGCRMSSTPCSARPGRFSGSSPSTPAAGTGAARCWPASSARRSCSAWSAAPATRPRSPARCSTGPRTCPCPGRPASRTRSRSSGSGCCTTTASPAPDALEQLLRGAAEIKSAAVLGPKIMDWADRQVILEAGVTIDTAGRRITGIEPREVDQGQHDGDRDSLAVGSAGMLVRRDVWDEVGGFDTAMTLFREDVDFCWRVHAAGYRVRVITGAVAYHLEAAARRRRDRLGVPPAAPARPGQRAAHAADEPAGLADARVAGRQYRGVGPAHDLLPGGEAAGRGAGRARGRRFGARASAPAAQRAAAARPRAAGRVRPVAGRAAAWPVSAAAGGVRR